MHRLLIIFVLLLMRCGGTPSSLPPGLKDAYGQFGLGGFVKLHPSPHCVYPGETITWTLTVSNEGESDLRLVDTPPLDIVLQDTHGNRVRWSDDPTYPVIPPVVPAHSSQTYTWVWTATTLDGPSRAILRGQGEDRIDAELNFGINEMIRDTGRIVISSCDSIR